MSSSSFLPLIMIGFLPTICIVKMGGLSVRAILVNGYWHFNNFGLPRLPFPDIIWTISPTISGPFIITTWTLNVIKFLTERTPRIGTILHNLIYHNYRIKRFSKYGFLTRARIPCNYLLSKQEQNQSNAGRANHKKGEFAGDISTGGWKRVFDGFLRFLYV